MIAYIFERFVIHFFAACSLVLCAYFGFSWLVREYGFEFIPVGLQARLAFSALFVWSLSTLREAYDVAHGQPLKKAYFDYLSWFLGCACAAWGLYRFAI
jgi:hypothetical protein